MRVIKENIPMSSDKVLLEYYRGKLVPDYLQVLEASLIVRSMSRKKLDIKNMKRDITRAFPRFGRNLCNLTSEGYFHNHFNELYESMSKEEDFYVKDYQKQVEKIVVGLPYTAFVNSIATVDTTVREILSKIERLKKYGAGRFLIHALGKDNVEKTEKILKKIREKDDSIEIDIEKRTNRITATLKF